MTKGIKKVGGAKAEPKAKKEKVQREEWDVKEALDVTGKSCVNDKGELTAVPANFPTSGVLPLKRGAFASRKLYFQHRAALIDRQMDTLTERKQEFLDRAAGKDTGSVKRRLAKAEKLRKQLAELEEQLRAEGVESV